MLTRTCDVCSKVVTQFYNISMLSKNPTIQLKEFDLCETCMPNFKVPIFKSITNI